MLTTEKKSKSYQMKLNIDILKVDQVTQKYVDWYSDRDVVQYSDNQYRDFSFNGQRSYVANCLENDDLRLYGIFDDTKHIGNIMLTGLTSFHQRAEVSYVIGDANYRKKGVATFAISRMVEIGKKEFHLQKLYAGVASGNIGSRKALENNGFVLEGIRKRHLRFAGNFYDQLDFGRLL